MDGTERERERKMLCNAHTCLVILWWESLVLSLPNYAHLNVNIFSNFPFQMNSDPNDAHCLNEYRCANLSAVLLALVVVTTTMLKVIIALCHRCDCSFRND